MLILKDKTGEVICEADNIIESYNPLSSYNNKKTVMSVTIRSDREKGITLNSVVEKFTNADLSEISVWTEDGAIIETYTEYSQLLAVVKTVVSTAMTIDVTLSDKVETEIEDEE